MRFGKSEERTSTVFQSLEPVWESNDGGNEFIFDVRSLEQNIVVAVWDEDENDADDFMCEVSIPISELPQSYKDAGLRNAAVRGRVQIVETLLESGAVDKADSDGDTALLMAVMLRHTHSVRAPTERPAARTIDLLPAQTRGRERGRQGGRDRGRK